MIESKLYAYMDALLSQTDERFHRYLYTAIDWNARMVGIVGPRGVGKTTMVLQYIKEHKANYRALYVSADNTYFSAHTLVDLADEWAKDMGKVLVIDEVHKYPDWSRELKQIYDTHPDLRVIFTGSSILDIARGSADLSRRALMYTLQGLSFREYLGLFHHIEVPVYTLCDILANRAKIEGVLHPLPYFRQYLETGYYPFAIEGNFIDRMQMVVSQTVESDIAQYADIKASTARKLKKMLAVIAASAPFKPNADSLATAIGISRNNVADYLLLLERAQMIGQLRDDTGGIRGLGKVEKVYLDNPSLMYALIGPDANIGNVRETFFYNQMRVNQDVMSSRVSDFTIAGNTFEIGGQSKGKRQIADIENGFVVRDDIEVGYGNILPLWTFGLNY